MRERNNLSTILDDSSSVWRPSNGVLECEESDLTVLLSIDTGEYHTLDNTAGHLWRHLRQSARSVSNMASFLAATYELEPVNARSDVEAWLDTMAARQLIEPVRQLAPRKTSTSRSLRLTSRIFATPTERPSVARCLLGLAFVRGALRTVGLRATLRGLYSTPTVGVQLPERIVRRIVRSTVRAGALSPFKAQCLEQSLCIAWWLRGLGANAEVSLGAMPYPFKAHAWAECDGIPVNETIEGLKLYRRFSSISLESL